MIIIVAEGATHFVNEKDYDVVSHDRNNETAVCKRRDLTREYTHVTGVAYIPDGNDKRYVSGFCQMSDEEL